MEVEKENWEINVNPPEDELAATDPIQDLFFGFTIDEEPRPETT